MKPRLSLRRRFKERPVLGYYLRLALKSFRRTPGLTALMICSVALGISVCIVTLTVIKWVRPVERYKKRLYLSDHNMQIFLITVTLLVLTTTSLGIFGLSTFNVSSRTKQIGTRRALGARKLDILQYFMVENALVTTAGIVLGCVLALGMGYWLSLEYKLPRLNLYYLVGGVLALWGIGQLAVWQPARRASSVSPSVATRTI
jgi:putative ABC transport system permease protein